ncbi:WW domain binding protein 11-domain-containing protein [Amylocarpus encephaloides]|uniref:WW domain binding protein 11-domain-containing protein n=1 Tax=Amylocarpus encephaloides TaxID=45428 RepID=A0A9P7YU58_9HELO|nr:WW domain binding protein 11-domain-containing protein [Amylocarpus encephaloides]
MPKEKSVNPAQAQRKAEKAKAIKKGKTAVQASRTERLAKRNPDRVQKQLDDLKAIESSGGKLTSHEKSILEGLEKELKAVRKARETLGDKAPKFGSVSSRGGFEGGRGGRGGGRGDGVLGKRRRDEEGSSDESEVDEETKRIPMPRDTPPPFPKEVLDKWYQKRRERWQANNPDRQSNDRQAGTSANAMPLGDNARMFPDRSGNSGDGSAPHRPVEEVKTVYEAKPALRDLRKEAVAFVPSTVRMKMDKSKGIGGLMEPEEADKLEKSGYLGAGKDEKRPETNNRTVQMEEVEDEDA